MQFHNNFFYILENHYIELIFYEETGFNINEIFNYTWWLKNETIKIKSKPLITELKAFIASGVTFKAKVGEYDDLVSSMLLSVRMTQILADWDPRVFERISSRDAWEDEDFDPPMPIFVSSTI